MSIYASIGGAPAVRAAVDDFYALVLADQRLAPFFAGTDLQRLKVSPARVHRGRDRRPRGLRRPGHGLRARRARYRGRRLRRRRGTSRRHADRAGRARGHDRADSRCAGAASRRHCDHATGQASRLARPRCLACRCGANRRPRRRCEIGPSCARYRRSDVGSLAGLISVALRREAGARAGAFYAGRGDRPRSAGVQWFLAGRAGAKKSMSSWVTRSASS